MKIKFNNRFYFIFVAIGAVIALVIRVLTMLALNKITMEDNEPMSAGTRLLLACLFIIVTSSYLYSFVNMAITLIKNKLGAFTIDDKGVHNCLTYTNFLAFVFVARVKYIPWDALSDIHSDMGGYLKAYVDTSKIKASPLAKLLLKMNGYRFGFNFVSQKLTYDDLLPFVKE